MGIYMVQTARHVHTRTKNSSSHTVAPAIPRDEKIEQQIETLLKKMTLDEKVGQMCELTIDLLQKRANPFAGLNPKDITVDDLKKIVKRYKLEKEFKLGKEMPSQEVMMQQYFFISASVQAAIEKYKKSHKDIRKFYEKATFQIGRASCRERV